MLFFRRGYAGCATVCTARKLHSVVARRDDRPDDSQTRSRAYHTHHFDARSTCLHEGEPQDTSQHSAFSCRAHGCLLTGSLSIAGLLRAGGSSHTRGWPPRRGSYPSYHASSMACIGCAELRPRAAALRNPDTPNTPTRPWAVDTTASARVTACPRGCRELQGRRVWISGTFTRRCTHACKNPSGTRGCAPS